MYPPSVGSGSTVDKSTAMSREFYEFFEDHFSEKRENQCGSLLPVAALKVTEWHPRKTDGLIGILVARFVEDARGPVRQRGDVGVGARARVQDERRRPGLALVAARAQRHVHTLLRVRGIAEQNEVAHAPEARLAAA